MPEQTFSDVQPVAQTFTDVAPLQGQESKPGFFQDPKAFMQNRAGEMQAEAQRHNNLFLGPEAQGHNWLSRFAHGVISYAPATASVIDKLIAGGMDWKNAIVTAAGAVDPAIPGAYFMTQGTGQLTGLTPGVEKGNLSPENVQNALLAGSAVAGGAASSASPKAGNAAQPGAATSRALLLGKTPQEAYQSALKPSTTLSEGERADITNTGLREGIPVSKAGVQKIGDLIDNLNQQIKATIATDPNRPISTRAAASTLPAVKAKFATQVNPESDMAAVDASRAEFLKNNPNSLTAADAQAMKQGTYRALGDKAYGEVKSASIESQKALARGLKDELGNAFPELSKLNVAEGKLFDLQPVLEKAVARIGNHQLVGIGTPVVTGAAKALTGSSKIAAAAGIMKAVLDNPLVKSKLAISLWKSGMPYPQAVARVQAYEASLASAVPGLLSSSSGDKTTNQETGQP